MSLNQNREPSGTNNNNMINASMGSDTAPQKALQERMFLAIGSSTTCLTDEEVQAHLLDVFENLGVKKNILIIPPDYTRSHSRAGLITNTIFEHYDDTVKNILPALGTHKYMTEQELNQMYPGIPHDRFRNHNWREVKMSSL